MTAATPAPCTRPGAHVVGRLASDELLPWTAVAQTGGHDGSFRRGFGLGQDGQTAFDAGLAVLQTTSLPRP